MVTKDGYPPNDHSPLFLSEHADETGQPDIEKAWDRAVISSRILKATIFVGAATAIAIAILWVGNPAALVANVTASWIDASALQPATEPPASTVQSTAAAQDLPTPTRDAPTRDETAAAVEPADQGQAGTGQPLTEDLFKQFQAWAAEEDTRAQAVPLQSAQASPPTQPAQPLQGPPVRVAQDAPAQAQPAKKYRRVRSVHNARAEIRPQRHARARYREEQRPPAPIAPVPEPRLPEPPPVQNSQTPWLLQSLGLRN
jgi:hypothetical protein